jgi:hypothetical protein
MHDNSTFRSWASNMIGRPFTKEDIDEDSATRFNAKSLLGKSCMIKVEHVEKEGRVSAKVANLMQMPEGVPEPHQVNESIYFSIEPGFDEEVFEGLSPWCKAKIETSETYRALKFGGHEADAVPRSQSCSSRGTAW